MTKALLILVCSLLALLAAAVLALFIQSKFYKGRLEKQKRDFLEQWNELQLKQKEILDNAKQKKESLHSGNSDTNFNNSLNVLQNLAAGREKNNSD